MNSYGSHEFHSAGTAQNPSPPLTSDRPPAHLSSFFLGQMEWPAMSNAFWMYFFVYNAVWKRFNSKKCQNVPLNMAGKKTIIVHWCLTRIVIPSVSPCHSINNPIQYFAFSNDLFSIMLHRSCLGCSRTTRCQPRMLATCLKADCKANGTAKRAPSKKKSHQKCDLKTGLRF